MPRSDQAGSPSSSPVVRFSPASDVSLSSPNVMAKSADACRMRLLAALCLILALGACTRGQEVWIQQDAAAPTPTPLPTSPQTEPVAAPPPETVPRPTAPPPPPPSPDAAPCQAVIDWLVATSGVAPGYVGRVDGSGRITVMPNYSFPADLIEQVAGIAPPDSESAEQVERVIDLLNRSTDLENQATENIADLAVDVNALMNESLALWGEAATAWGDYQTFCIDTFA